MFTWTNLIPQQVIRYANIASRIHTALTMNLFNKYIQIQKQMVYQSTILKYMLQIKEQLHGRTRFLHFKLVVDLHWVQLGVRNQLLQYFKLQNFNRLLNCMKNYYIDLTEVSNTLIDDGNFDKIIINRDFGRGCADKEIYNYSFYQFYTLNQINKDRLEIQDMVKRVLFAFLAQFPKIQYRKEMIFLINFFLSFSSQTTTFIFLSYYYVMILGQGDYITHTAPEYGYGDTTRANKISSIETFQNSHEKLQRLNDFSQQNLKVYKDSFFLNYVNFQTFFHLMGDLIKNKYSVLYFEQVMKSILTLNEQFITNKETKQYSQINYCILVNTNYEQIGDIMSSIQEFGSIADQIEQTFIKQRNYMISKNYQLNRNFVNLFDVKQYVEEVQEQSISKLENQRKSRKFTSQYDKQRNISGQFQDQKQLQAQIRSLQDNQKYYQKKIKEMQEQIDLLLEDKEKAQLTAEAQREKELNRLKTLIVVKGLSNEEPNEINKITQNEFGYFNREIDLDLSSILTNVQINFDTYKQN